MENILRFTSDLDLQNGVAQDLNVHHSTVCNTVKYAVDKIIEKATDCFK